MATIAQQAVSEGHAQARGIRVITILAVLTAVEFAIAISLASPSGLVVLLTIAALLKAGLIMNVFMHLPKLWRDDGGH